VDVSFIPNEYFINFFGLIVQKISCVVNNQLLFEMEVRIAFVGFLGFFFGMPHRVRQSAKLFLQSPELGLPQPLARRRVCPPPLDSGGRGRLAGERGGGRIPIPTRGHTL
jgi:hypothetical protein